MADFYECFTCHKVLPLSGEGTVCPSCGGSNGQVIPPEQVIKGIEAGTYSSPTTGGRGKKKRG